jgi:hypothetical protein
MESLRRRTRLGRSATSSPHRPTGKICSSLRIFVALRDEEATHVCARTIPFAKWYETNTESITIERKRSVFDNHAAERPKFE